MNNSHKIYSVVLLAATLVCVILHIANANYPAAIGWSCSAMWSMIALGQEKRAERYYIRAKDEKDRCTELLKINSELKSKICRYETEEIDDGK